MSASDETPSERVILPGQVPPVVPPPTEEDGEAGSGETSADRETLFSGASLRTPIEELEAIFERHFRRFESSASHTQLDRLGRAYKVAQEHLAQAMKSSLTPASRAPAADMQDRGEPGSEDSSEQEKPV